MVGQVARIVQLGQRCASLPVGRQLGEALGRQQLAALQQGQEFIERKFAHTGRQFGAATLRQRGTSVSSRILRLHQSAKRFVMALPPNSGNNAESTDSTLPWPAETA